MRQTLRKPTRQEAFDMAARHLLAQGKPSGAFADDGGFSCTYRGSGCALRPFIPDDVDPKYWDLGGGVESLVTSNQQGKVPAFIEEDLPFYSDLQTAHDDSAIRADGDPAEWLPLWREDMIELAGNYDLDASVVRDVT